jgi:hypothetical protein
MPWVRHALPEPNEGVRVSASLAAEIARMMGDSEDEDTARLVAELEAMSGEEAELLAGDLTSADGGQRL